MVKIMLSNDATLGLVSAIATVNEQLADWARQLRARSDVFEVTRGMDVRNYESGITMEFFVEADFGDERPLTWWIDVMARTHSWVIEGSVRALQSGDQITLQEYASRTATSAEDVAVELRQLVSCLLHDAPHVIAKTRKD